MRAAFRGFSARAHCRVAFFCYSLMVNNDKRGPSLKAMHSLILARSVHCASKVNLIHRPGGNQGHRSGSFVSELKIRHGLLGKHWSMKRGDGSPPPSQIHDTHMSETKEENAPKTLISPRLLRPCDWRIATSPPSRMFHNCHGSHVGWTCSTDGCEDHIAPPNDRPISRLCLRQRPVTGDRMHPYQMGTRRVIYLHNLCSARGNFISALTFRLSVSDTLPRPAGGPVSLT